METLEEAAENYQKHFGVRPNLFAQDDFIQGAKWYKELYQEEIKLLKEELEYEKRRNVRENR